jgi:hypothetical protein
MGVESTAGGETGHGGRLDSLAGRIHNKIMKGPLKPSVLGLLLLAPLSALPAGAQLAPLGPETVVVSDGRNIDYCPQVIGHADRSFTVVWTERPGGGAFSLRAQRFDGTGTRVGEPIRVDAGGLVGRVLVSVAAENLGTQGDIVVWGSYVQNQPTATRRFNDRVLSANAPAKLSTPSYVTEVFPRRTGGGYLGTWQGSIGLFDATGRPASPPFRLKGAGVENLQTAQALDGTFAVAWFTSATQKQLVVQRFGANGKPLGAPAGVPAFVAGADLASAPDGETVLSWVDDGPDFYNPATKVRLRFIAPNGSPEGAIQDVTTTPGDVISSPAVAMDGSGDALVVWSLLNGTADYNVQLWTPDGAASPPVDLAANPIEIGRGSFCASAAAAGRTWVVAWWALLPTGEPAIFVRRFSS